MERPERIVLVIIGALFNRMAPVLWILAVISTITVIHRIKYTYEQTTLLEAAKRGEALSQSESAVVT
jgi:CDP-diacylglycerol--glycerol-3-phosphate 3-phosphatidyltransferase